jgi:hypothetical protein
VQTSVTRKPEPHKCRWRRARRVAHRLCENAKEAAGDLSHGRRHRLDAGDPEYGIIETDEMDFRRCPRRRKSAAVSAWPTLVGAVKQSLPICEGRRCHKFAPAGTKKVDSQPNSPNCYRAQFRTCLWPRADRWGPDKRPDSRLRRRDLLLARCPRDVSRETPT